MKHEEFYDNGNVKSICDYNDEDYKSGYCLFFNEEGEKTSHIKFENMMDIEYVKDYVNNRLDCVYYSKNHEQYGIGIYCLN